MGGWRCVKWVRYGLGQGSVARSWRASGVMGEGQGVGAIIEDAGGDEVGACGSDLRGLRNLYVHIARKGV